MKVIIRYFCSSRSSSSGSIKAYRLNNIRSFSSTMKHQLKINPPTTKTFESTKIDILKHFEPVKFVPIPSQTFFCKDSRGDEMNFGAPGGDFGEFLLALDCFYALNEVKSSADQVDEYLGRWLDERCSKTRPFYLHSDRVAVNKILETLNSKKLENLSATEQEGFIETFSRFQGCGHLRLILEDQKSYEIDPQLFKYLARAFFSRYFKGDERLLFKIYECAQDGKALAVISGGLDDKNSVLGLPSKDNEQIFILNQHAVSSFRKNYLVPFFCSDRPAQDALFQRIEEKGWRNAMLSAKALAGDKPIYNIEIQK